MTKTVVVTLHEHFSSMGTSHSYRVDGRDEAWFWGLPLAELFPETEFGTAARFRVSIEVLDHGTPVKNPWRNERG